MRSVDLLKITSDIGRIIGRNKLTISRELIAILANVVIALNKPINWLKTVNDVVINKSHSLVEPTSAN